MVPGRKKPAYTYLTASWHGGHLAVEHSELVLIAGHPGRHEASRVQPLDLNQHPLPVVPINEGTFDRFDGIWSYLWLASWLMANWVSELLSRWINFNWISGNWPPGFQTKSQKTNE
jgi:hypothetical protein